MKIGLISPRGLTTIDDRLEKIFQNSKDVQGYIDSLSKAFSSGLLVIAALTPKNIDIKIIDENFEHVDYNENFDLIGISAMTQQASQAYEIAGAFRNRSIPVVIGGIHATVMPQEVKEHCDAVFIGEAEYTWPVFLNDFNNGVIKQFYKSEKPADMAASPLPRYDLVNKNNYRVIWMQTSRGCPHDCEFCSASRVYGYTYRHKSISGIIEELQCIKKIWPHARINFADDNLFVDKHFSKELIKHIKKLNIRWFAQTDISVAYDNELLNLLKESGCTTLFIGFESISEKSLESINKNSWKLKQFSNYSNAIEKIQSRGIGIVGAFIIGFDGDTKEIISELSDFIIENNIFVPQITILTPLPGSRLYERLKNENRILNNPWKHYTFTEINYIPKNISIEDLKNELYSIYEKVYSRETRYNVLNHFKTIFKTI
jgi:radical SAM superfamily enzyme YgiQ (UPF0313 family)